LPGIHGCNEITTNEARATLMARWTPMGTPGFDRHLLANLGSLYGLQVARYLIPLITIPFLARVLGADGWGEVAFLTAYGQFFIILIDFGFHISGTREIARLDARSEHRAEVVAGVWAAKLLLVLLAAVCAALARQLSAKLAIDDWLYWSAVAAAVIEALDPLWYFQGRQKLAAYVAVNLAARFGGLLLMFAVIREPGDAWLYFLFRGASWGLVVAIGIAMMYRHLPPVMPTIGRARQAFAMGWSIFQVHAAGAALDTAIPFALGFVAPASVVGYLVGADRIARAFYWLLDPIRQAMFPRISALVQSSLKRAAQAVRRILLLFAGVSIVSGLAILLLAPFLVRLLLGGGYDAAVPTLRLLSIFPLLVALNNVIGVQWMLPLGLERPFAAINITAGSLRLILCLCLAPFFAQNGAAVAILAAESTTLVLQMLYLRRRRMSPLELAAMPDPP
jgi:PST family polysaccharide transporter